MLLFCEIPTFLLKMANILSNPLDKRFVLVYTKWDRLSQRCKMLKIE